MIEIDPRYDYFQEYQHDMNKRGFLLDNWLLHLYQTGRFLRWLWDQKKDLPDVTPEVIDTYLRHRKDKGHQHSTLIQISAVLRDFFRFAIRDQLIEQDPMKEVSCRWLDIPGGFVGYQGALKRFLKDPYSMWKFRLPLFAPHWETYLHKLLDQGYAKHSLFHVLERGLYFHRYLAQKKIGAFRDVTFRHLKDFFKYNQQAFQKKRNRSMAPSYQDSMQGTLTRFLTFAFQQEGRCLSRLPSKIIHSVIPDSLLDRYIDFCRTHQGLAVSTHASYRRVLVLLRSFLDRRGIKRLEKVTLTDLDAFLMKQTNVHTPRGLRSLATGLRSFFRFLHLQGDISSDIAQGVMSPSRFSADLRPKYLPWKKVLHLLNSVNRRHKAGKRDYAILSLVAGHGLRTREVANLKISDVDWEKHSIFLQHRKRGGAAHLPITIQTEEALRDYLNVRPRCEATEIFLTTYAPIKPLGKNISACVQRHVRRVFGDTHRPSGAHMLRHSFAKALLDQGAPLHEVGSLLGHRTLRSTLIYTRINTEDLREVADNYSSLL